MEISRRGFLAGAGGTATLGTAALANTAAAMPKQIKAFCVDFNWYKGVFAPPGHWGDASPEQHVRWYEALGANTIQTFCVSCNGYAWYKGGFVPPQPGLKHDFLTDVVRLGHKRGMLVMGYFCVGANTKWATTTPISATALLGIPSTFRSRMRTSTICPPRCRMRSGRPGSTAT